MIPQDDGNGAAQLYRNPKVVPHGTVLFIKRKEKGKLGNNTAQSVTAHTKSNYPRKRAFGFGIFGDGCYAKIYMQFQELHTLPLGTLWSDAGLLQVNMVN